MDRQDQFSAEEVKYLKLLSKRFPTIQTVSSEIINLRAILDLPKGTEHFMSDLHGEHEAFLHILNNCSGVIREKVDIVFGNSVFDDERASLATLIYYPGREAGEDQRGGAQPPPVVPGDPSPAH